MTNLSRLCIFLLVAAVCIAGCAKQAPSLLHDPNPYDAPLPPFSTPVTREEVREAFYKYSVLAIVKKLKEGDAANWNMILDKIAEGDKDWITYAAIYIVPGADAANATELLVSFAYGLPRNPEAVLAQEVAGLGLSMLNVCTIPFIEPTYDFVKNYGEETLAALLRVDKPYLVDSRDTCIRRLREILDRSEKAFAEGRWDASEQ
jgi:hypothetical protein